MKKNKKNSATHSDPAVSGAKVPVGSRPDDPDKPIPVGSKWVYVLVLLFTALIFGRPEDLIPALVSFHLPLVVGSLAAVPFALALLFGKRRVFWCKELKIVLLLTCWFLASIPFGYWRSNSIYVFQERWLKTLLIFFLLTQTVHSISRIWRLLWVIILCELIVTSLSAVLGHHEVVAEGGRDFGMVQGMLSGNYLGITVGMVFPFMAVVIVRARSFIQSLVVVTTFGVAMWMVVLAASRSGMFTVFLSILISWALILRGSIRGWGLGVLVVIALCALLLLAPPTFWARMGTVWGDTNSFNGVSASAAESAADRKQLLQDSITYTLEHPILGVGIGNFAIVRGVRSGGDPGAWLGTHNLLTQISSENGIPALLLYLALVVVLLKNLAKIAFSPSRGPETAELRLCARASIVSVLVFIYAGFFAHLAYDYYFYYLAGIGVGLQVAARNLEHDSREGDDARAFLRPAYPVQGHR